MAYALYGSIDELLAPHTLTALIGQPVKYVRCLPMQHVGYSGSHLLAVEADAGTSNMRFVLKRMSGQWDWVMLASDDRHCRSVALWQSGLLDQLQPGIDHAILACARDGDGWALLMRDVSAGLMDNQARTVAEVEYLLDMLATLHAQFWQAPALDDPALGLCDTQNLLCIFSPVTAHRLPSTTSQIPQMISDGWILLQEMAAPDVVDVLHSLYTDPQPLCAALARYPATLVHSDYRTAHFAIARKPAPRMALLDWQCAGYSAGTVDLAWLFSMPDIQLSPITTDAACDYYRGQLAQRLGTRFNEDWWPPLLALGALANILRHACIKAWFIVNVHHVDEVVQAAERRMIELYNEQVRTALQWL